MIRSLTDFNFIMAIINCPSCNQRISSRLSLCPHCQFDFLKNTSPSGLSKEELFANKERLIIKKKYRLQIQASASLFLLLLGVFLWSYNNFEIHHWRNHLYIGFIFLGAFLYLTTRIRLFVFK
jgi:hypothetical protein